MEIFKTNQIIQSKILDFSKQTLSRYKVIILLMVLNFIPTPLKKVSN